MRSSWIEVDLSAIEDNVRTIRSFLKPAVKLLATVKGNAYGHGAAEVSRLLERLGVDAFGVAFAEEGVTLRESGITKPILLYGRTFSDSYGLLFDYDLTPNIFDVENALEISEEAVKRGKTLKVHVSIDTGLARLGIDLKDGTKEIIEQIMDMPGLEVEGIFSMFANSRVRSGFEKTDTQMCIKQFEKMADLRNQLEKDGRKISCWHIADSAAAMLFPQTQMDMVRIGSSLFGAWITDVMPKDISFRPAMSIHSRLACVRQLPAGQPVGYNGSYVTEKPAVLGVVPFGTADGLSGKASGGSFVLLGGIKCPIIGDTCMDQVIIDISEVKDPRIGDEVVIIGRQGDEEITARETAESAGAEDLEYLCRMSLRSPIRYI